MRTKRPRKGAWFIEFFAIVVVDLNKFIVVLFVFCVNEALRSRLTLRKDGQGLQGETPKRLNARADCAELAQIGQVRRRLMWGLA
jgi:hypothetical protein